MYTSILLAVTGLYAPEAGVSPEWKADYSQARREVADKKKPLAVFFAPGKNAWEAISEGKVSNEARKLLAQRYVCLFVDTGTEDGKSLAKWFEVGNSGLIISDRTGNLQAFSHSGKLASDDIQFYLERYSDPDRAVRDTETHRIRRTSSYVEPSSPSGSSDSGSRSSRSYCPT